MKGLTKTKSVVITLVALCTVTVVCSLAFAKFGFEGVQDPNEAFRDKTAKGTKLTGGVCVKYLNIRIEGGEIVADGADILLRLAGSKTLHTFYGETDTELHFGDPIGIRDALRVAVGDQVLACFFGECLGGCDPDDCTTFTPPVGLTIESIGLRNLDNVGDVRAEEGEGDTCGVDLMCYGYVLADVVVTVQD
jgi:hypothetical protein